MIIINLLMINIFCKAKNINQEADLINPKGLLNLPDWQAKACQTVDFKNQRFLKSPEPERPGVHYHLSNAKHSINDNCSCDFLFLLICFFFVFFLFFFCFFILIK